MDKINVKILLLVCLGLLFYSTRSEAVATIECKKVWTNSGGGWVDQIVGDCELRGGGGSTGNGGDPTGGGGGGNDSAGNDTSTTGTIDAEEQCELDSLEQKQTCVHTATVLAGGTAVLCLKFVAPPAIALCEAANLVGYEHAKSECEIQHATRVAKCD